MVARREEEEENIEICQKSFILPDMFCRGRKVRADRLLVNSVVVSATASSVVDQERAECSGRRSGRSTG
jgi:hypothetical protein